MKIGMQRDKSNVEVLNLLSNDASNIEKWTVYSPYLIVGPLKALIIIAILIKRTNYMMLSGLVLFLMLLPVQASISKLFSVFKWVDA